MAVAAKTSLVSCLKNLRRIVDTKHAIEIYRTFCFRDGKVSGFSGEVGALAPSPIRSTGCLHAETVMKVLSILGDTDITFEPEQGGQSLQIRSGGYKTTIQMWMPNGFPDILPRSISSYAPKCTGLAAALRRVAFSSGDWLKVSKPGGIGFRGHYLYATDGCSYSRQKLDFEVA